MWGTFVMECVLSKTHSAVDAFLEYPKFSGTLWKVASAVEQLCEICKEIFHKLQIILHHISSLYYFTQGQAVKVPVK